MNERLNLEQEPQTGLVEVEFIANEAGQVEFASDDTPSVATYVELIKEPTRIQFTDIMEARHAELASAA